MLQTSRQQSYGRMAVWVAATAMLYLSAGTLADRVGAVFAQDAQEAAEGAAADADAADGVPAETSTEAGSEMRTSAESLGRMIISGGSVSIVFYIILLLFSVWAFSISMERLVNLRREKMLPSAFAARLNEMLRSGSDDAASLRELSRSSPAPVARILHAGVLKAGRTLPEVEKAMEDAVAREIAALRTRNRPLSVVGSVAPLLGLLGTVVGMIFAFQVSSQEGLGKAERLAEGIYLALMTTAAGLTIAIPCLLLVAWFNTKVERFMCDIDECLMETIPSFARMEGQPVSPTSNAPSESRSNPESPRRSAVTA